MNGDGHHGHYYRHLDASHRKSEADSCCGVGLPSLSLGHGGSNQGTKLFADPSGVGAAVQLRYLVSSRVPSLSLTMDDA